MRFYHASKEHGLLIDALAASSEIVCVDRRLFT
jgi:hypothetical protein